MAYDILPATEIIQRTVESVNARGVHTELVETKEAALKRVQALITRTSPKRFNHTCFPFHVPAGSGKNFIDRS
jgi:hypothetical protein